MNQSLFIEWYCITSKNTFEIMEYFSIYIKLEFTCYNISQNPEIIDTKSVREILMDQNMKWLSACFLRHYSNSEYLNQFR